MNNYIFTSKIDERKIKPNRYGTIFYIQDREKCKELCLKEYGYSLPDSHNLLQINGNDILIALS